MDDFLDLIAMEESLDSPPTGRGCSKDCLTVIIIIIILAFLGSC